MSKYDQAYRTISERIMSGQYGPGYSLTLEHLSRELGMSTIPIREALRSLEAEGLVHYEANSGARVAPVDSATYVEALNAAAVLEGYATALASAHLTEADKQQLRMLNEEMRQSFDALDLLNCGTINRQFHNVIYERCPNRFAIHTLNQTWIRLDRIRRTIFVTIPSRARAALTEHEDLILALEQGAPAIEVELLARRHKENTARAFVEWQELHEKRGGHAFV